MVNGIKLRFVTDVIFISSVFIAQVGEFVTEVNWIFFGVKADELDLV